MGIGQTECFRIQLITVCLSHDEFALYFTVISNLVGVHAAVCFLVHKIKSNTTYFDPYFMQATI